MSMQRPTTRSERGQTLTLFALMLVAMLLAVGLVVDVGWALSQQRTAQNAADFAAVAGTRILGEFYTNQPVDAGNDTNVSDAVNSVLAANNAQLISATYVDGTGLALTGVGGGSIPTGAAGVVVNAMTSWKPFFLGIMGVTQWSAQTTASAATQAAATGGVLPVGLEGSTFGSLPYCDPTSPSFGSCLTVNSLEPGSLVIPGGFGWLSFGAQGFCAGYGLGMDPNAGCTTSQGALQAEVGPPASSHGCCTDLTLTPDEGRRIGSLTGNKPVDLTYYIQNKIPVWVPIWDYAGSNGRSGYYHIVGFAAVVFTGQDTLHGKWLTGVAVSKAVGNSPNATLLGATGKVTLIH
jgi:Putative Flp pilus-assembly TadE/G-like